MKNEKPDNANYLDAASTGAQAAKTSAATESGKALAALGGSIHRIRRILSASKPAKWAEQHPIITAVAAAGVSAVVTATICRSLPAENGNSSPSRIVRSRAFRLIASTLKMLTLNWLGENVLKPASAEFVETASTNPLPDITE